MISILAKDLRGMFKQVTPHMDDPENYVPVIASVRLEARDGWLYAIATDRYTIAAARRPISVDRNGTGHVPGHLVPAFEAMLDAASSFGDDVTLTLPSVGSDGPCSLVLATPGRRRLTVEYEPDDYKHFPDWRKILRATLTAEPTVVPLTGFTTRMLTRWEHSAAKLIAWQDAPGKPMVLLDELGYFAGLHMPVNFHWNGMKREDAASGWIAATTPTAVVDGVTYDLDKTWEDRHDDPWTYSGKDTPDGMPLMVLDGIDDDPHPLDRLISQYGPLYAVDL